MTTGKIGSSFPLFPKLTLSLIITITMTDETNHEDDKSRLISLAEAAEIYGFNPRFLGELARKGRLKAKKVGYSWVTTPEDVEYYIFSRKKTGLYRDDIQIDD